MARLDAARVPVPAGVYVARLEVGPAVQTGTLVRAR